MKRVLGVWAFLALMGGLGGLTVRGEDRSVAELTWPEQTAENRVWTRWWWMGDAVDAKNLTRQLEMFHAAGIGGVEICPIYGVYGQENRYIDFLSPKWVEMLAHTCKEASRLGMKVDMTTGTGWPFGGKSTTVEDASSGLVIKRFAKVPTPEELPKGKLVGLICIDAQGRARDLVTAMSDVALTGPYYALVQVGPQQKVKRAAPGAEGNVLDPYSTQAMGKYLGEFDRALGAGGGVPGDKEHWGDGVRAQFHDSFEYYSATWTPDFLAEFQKRRGYDLRTQVAAMNNEAPAEVVARVKCDYRETLSDLHREYMERWAEWAHAHKELARNQAHGGPGNILDIYANADIPECEIFHLYEEGHLPMLKLASSGAHLAGHQLSSSESYTWLDEHFSASLAQVKPATDFLFLAGVNHILLHGIPYSPEDAAWPGWQFYASVNFGPTGGLWHDFPAFAAYVARCQSILQANKPSADVLLYVPFHEFWSDPAYNDKLMVQFTTPGLWMKPYGFYEVATKLWEKGFAYDEVSDRLLEKVRVVGGKIRIGDAEYGALVIPRTPVMPLGTLKRIEELVKVGGCVVVQGELPAGPPGMAPEGVRREFATLREKLGGSVRVVPRVNAEALEKAGVAREKMVEMGLRFVRRERVDGFDYFVVNKGEAAVDDWVPLATGGRSGVIMDPRDAKRVGVAAVREGKLGSRVYLQLGVGESCIVRTYRDRAIAGGGWEYVEREWWPTELKGEWKVEFVEGGPVLPGAVMVGRLGSWTELGGVEGEEARRFAGTARYMLEFEHPWGNASDYLLELGKVGDSARVKLNGVEFGTLWAEPYQVRVGSALLKGKNRLEVEVTNVAANRIADMDRRGVQWKVFRDANVLSTGYTAFNAAKWPVRDAGLMGPVRLVGLRGISPSK